MQQRFAMKWPNLLSHFHLAGNVKYQCNNYNRCALFPINNMLYTCFFFGFQISARNKFGSICDVYARPNLLMKNMVAHKSAANCSFSVRMVKLENVKLVKMFSPWCCVPQHVWVQQKMTITCLLLQMLAMCAFDVNLLENRAIPLCNGMMTM